MGYGPDMMTVISKLWYGLVSQTHTQKCLFLKKFQWYKDTQQQTHFNRPLSPMFAHYIKLVLAAHKGQKGWLKK